MMHKKKFLQTWSFRRQKGNYSPEVLDILLLIIIALILVVLILAWWYKYHYYTAVEKNSENVNYIVELQQEKNILLEELEKHKKPIE